MCDNYGDDEFEEDGDDDFEEDDDDYEDIDDETTVTQTGNVKFT